MSTLMNTLIHPTHTSPAVSAESDAEPTADTFRGHSQLPTLVIRRNAEKQTPTSTATSAVLKALATPPSLRIAIKVRGTILFINLGEVVTVQAQGKCVVLQRNGSSYRLSESISVVAEKLETRGFIRIHRSVLVNTLFVEEIRPLSTGEYCLRVESGKEYTVTRTYKKNLRSLAEFCIGTNPFFES